MTPSSTAPLVHYYLTLYQDHHHPLQEFIDRMVGIRKSGSAIKLNNNNIPSEFSQLICSWTNIQETLLINPQESSRSKEMETISVSHFTDTTYCVCP